MTKLLNLFEANLNVEKDESTAKTSLSSRSFVTANDSIPSGITADDDSTILSCTSNEQPPNTTAFGRAFGNADELFCAPTDNPQSRPPLPIPERLKYATQSTLAKHLFNHAIENKDDVVRGRGQAADWWRKHVKIQVIWSGATISLLKSARTRSCRICAWERLFLIRDFHSIKTRAKIINVRDEASGQCTCETRFYRFCTGREGGSEEANK